MADVPRGTMDERLGEILVRGASKLGVELGEEAVDRFSVYLSELKAWNRKMNLTSIEGDEDTVVRHFLDSLAISRFIRGFGSLLDIGSGAGFPGIPVKIADPSIRVVLMDSMEKKVHFERHVIRTLRLTGIEAVHARAEDRNVMEKYGGSFDIVTSRAFTELKGFVHVATPYLKKGGYVVAIKGPAVEVELKGLEAGCEGLSAPITHHIPIPYSDRADNIVIFKKTGD